MSSGRSAPQGFRGGRALWRKCATEPPVSQPASRPIRVTIPSALPRLAPAPHRYRILRARGLCTASPSSIQPGYSDGPHRRFGPTVSSDRDLLPVIRNDADRSRLDPRPITRLRSCDGVAGVTLEATRRKGAGPPLPLRPVSGSRAPLRRVPQVPACHDPAHAGGG